MWSVSPKSRAVIRHQGAWERVDGCEMHIFLENPSSVVITYDMYVYGEKPHHPGGDFLNDNQEASAVRDHLTSRVVIDGVPYRQSGASVNPLSSLEKGGGELRSFVVLQLPEGNHTIALEWKKWGSVVRGWYNDPMMGGGYGASRTLAVTAEHHQLWVSQPLSPAYLSGADWKVVTGMSFTANLTHAGSMRITYVLPVRANTAPNADGK